MRKILDEIQQLAKERVVNGHMTVLLNHETNKKSYKEALVGGDREHTLNV